MRPRALLGLFVLLAALAGPRPGALAADEPVARAPYRLDYNGWFTIPVTVNGEGPFDFIVDTGATRTLVFRAFADAHALQPSGGPPQFVFGLGSAGSYPAYRIGEIAVGEARLPGLTSVVLADWPVAPAPAGVIGLDFLSRYIVVFDAEKKEAGFYAAAGETPAALRDWSTANLKKNDFGLRAGDLYTLAADLDYRSVSFLVDLGASGTVINRAAYEAILRRRALRRGALLTDALQKTKPADAIIIGRLDVARYAVFKNRLVFIQDAKIFADLGQAKRPFGLFGADLLVDRSFAFDFANDRFFIGPPVKEKTVKPRPEE